ncbi:hypothetical protein Hdeb2414_s0004g00127431 [Helianthus debilis subsp. tardiflorus]
MQRSPPPLPPPPFSPQPRLSPVAVAVVSCLPEVVLVREGGGKWWSIREFAGLQ